MTASRTYFDRPVLKEPVWIWSVPAYFFVGGASGAAATLGAVATLLGGARQRRLVRRSRMIALAGQVFGTLLLIVDLGRPERFLNMLRVFRPTSPLSIGSWVLAGSASLSGAALVLPGALGDAASYGSGALGLPLAGYTGVLLAGTAVPVWSESGRTLPVAFVGSAMASAACLLEALPLSDREDAVVRRFGYAGKTVELAGLGLMVAEASRVERVGRPYRRGASGAMLKASAALSAAGLVVSIVSRRRAARTTAATLGLAGSLLLRFGVFHAGRSSVRDPRATFELQRLTSADRT